MTNWKVDLSCKTLPALLLSTPALRGKRNSIEFMMSKCKCITWENDSMWTNSPPILFTICSKQTPSGAFCYDSTFFNQKHHQKYCFAVGAPILDYCKNYFAHQSLVELLSNHQIKKFIHHHWFSPPLSPDMANIVASIVHPDNDPWGVGHTESVLRSAAKPISQHRLWMTLVCPRDLTSPRSSRLIGDLLPRGFPARSRSQIFCHASRLDKKVLVVISSVTAIHSDVDEYKKKKRKKKKKTKQ